MVQVYRELEKALKKAKKFKQKTECVSGVKAFTNGLYDLLEVIEIYKEYLPEQTLNTLAQISREIAEYFTQESKYTPKEFGQESFKSRSIIQELNREIATLAKAMLWEISKEIEIEEFKRRRFKPRKIDTFVLKFWDQKEQIKKNLPAIEFFRKRLQEKSSTPEDKEDFELLKQIIDENREL